MNWGSSKPGFSTWATAGVIALLFGSLTTHGITIDFNDIPDGTAVSAPNPYAGIVNIHGSVSRQLWESRNPQTWYDDTVEPKVEHGEVRVYHPRTHLETEPGFVSAYYRSELTVDFLQPVINVSFTTKAWPYFPGYQYTALNWQGEQLTGRRHGIPESGKGREHVTIDLPDGYFLTQFRLDGSDPAQSSWGGFSLEEIQFNLAPVPDHGSSTAGLLGLVCVGLLTMRRSLGS